ncbi:hypothetical protein M404DRAFT_991764 [Pisolithus tinctorius Marx 270]|uniref:Uncharacterized protein n=1 Tax=Pisolithus tinctorius Marx 270 TaxID=870435 RepID=A0A0C3PZ46_PISTI|nr:hypothetical protein M404DRAFT_991764 [Pisolithus tinctorius Marx 270]
MSGLDFIYSDSMVTAFLAVLHFKLNDIVHLMSRNQRNIHSSAWTALQTSSRLKS